MAALRYGDYVAKISAAPASENVKALTGKPVDPKLGESTLRELVADFFGRNSADGHPHTLAFLATINNVPATHLGVSRFGQSGDLASIYRYHEIDTAAVVGAALDLVD